MKLKKIPMVFNYIKPLKFLVLLILSAFFTSTGYSVEDFKENPSTQRENQALTKQAKSSNCKAVVSPPKSTKTVRRLLRTPVQLEIKEPKPLPQKTLIPLEKFIYQIPPAFTKKYNFKGAMLDVTAIQEMENQSILIDHIRSCLSRGISLAERSGLLPLINLFLHLLREDEIQLKIFDGRKIPQTKALYLPFEKTIALNPFSYYDRSYEQSPLSGKCLLHEITHMAAHFLYQNPKELIPPGNEWKNCVHEDFLLRNLCYVAWRLDRGYGLEPWVLKKNSQKTKLFYEESLAIIIEGIAIGEYRGNSKNISATVRFIHDKFLPDVEKYLRKITAEGRIAEGRIAEGRIAEGRIAEGRIAEGKQLNCYST